MPKGFEDRVFLTDEEHATYLRRMPVRYVKHLKSETCYICGLAAQAGNPLENSHLVPFGIGIRRYRLTPDWLDGKHNIVTAHKSVCNKSAELSTEAIEQKVASLALK